MISPHVRRRADAALGPVLVVLLSLAAATQALRLWEWRPGVPLSLRSDSPQVLTQIRAIMSGDWYGVNPHVGAPFGMNQGWLTTADVVNFGSIRFLGLFSDSPATVGAIFFVLGFPAAALSAYWLGRQLELSRPAAVTVGVLFAVLPGHQLWFAHLWLAAYWMIPLAVWLVVQTAQGKPLWARHRMWLTLGVVTAVGLADVYYVAFTLILLALVLVFRLGTGTRAIQLLPGAGVTALIGLLCGGSLFVATRSRDVTAVTGALPAHRGVGESEIYAGKLIELALPWYEHRVGALKFLSTAYGIAAPPSVERPALGVVALLGVAMIAWAALTSLAFGRRLPALLGLLGALTLVSLAFYTRGGLGSVVALFFTPQIRTWSRFVVLIGLFGLLAVGLWITRAGRRHGRRASWAMAILALGVGVLDQTNPAVAPNYAGLRAEQHDLATYTHTVAAAVGRGCSVFQLPVVSYPEETPRGRMGDYDHLLPSIASPASLSWSYGAIRGTASADWQLALPVGDQPRLLGDLAAAGFCAVEINGNGYVDGTDLTSTTTRLLGAPLATSSRQHLTTYDLRPLRSALEESAGEAAVERRRQDVLRPVFASLNGSLIDAAGSQPFQWTGRSAEVTLSNMGSASVELSLSMKVEGLGQGWRAVKVQSPGSPDRTIQVSASHSEDVAVTVRAPAGRTRVTLTSTGESTVVPGTDGRVSADLKVSNLRLTTTSSQNAASLQQFAAASPPSLR